MQKGRERINEEFKKHVNVENTEAIKEVIFSTATLYKILFFLLQLINQSKAVEVELLTTVVQAKEIEPGKFGILIYSSKIIYILLKPIYSYRDAYSTRS